MKNLIASTFLMTALGLSVSMPAFGQNTCSEFEPAKSTTLGELTEKYPNATFEITFLKSIDFPKVTDPDSISDESEWPPGRMAGNAFYVVDGKVGAGGPACVVFFRDKYNMPTRINAGKKISVQAKDVEMKWTLGANSFAALATFANDESTREARLDSVMSKMADELHRRMTGDTLRVNKKGKDAPLPGKEDIAAVECGNDRFGGQPPVRIQDFDQRLGGIRFVVKPSATDGPSCQSAVNSVKAPQKVVGSTGKSKGTSVKDGR